ncbi:MAG: nicotinate-nucleotide adenylyltransferase [Ignavibacteriaceae bacterium]
MTRIGLFGGSFDPIHNGHILTSLSIKEKRDLEKIIFVPCHISPHKPEGGHSSPEHRMNLVKLGIANLPYFEVSDYEIQKGDVSYSIDTVRHFKQFYDKIDLIIGYDNLLVFDEWKDPDELVKLVELVVLRRKTESAEKQNRFFEYANFVETPKIPISSTEIRERIRQLRPVDFLVPDKVLSYIKENLLYL